MTVMRTPELITPEAPPHSSHGLAEATRLIIAASLGNALEFYEILVYGYFAIVIAKVFFPTADEAVSLLVTYGTFGASFLARPVGSMLFGHFGDRVGRKSTLVASMLVMGLSTTLIGFLPGYAQAGEFVDVKEPAVIDVVGGDAEMRGPPCWSRINDSRPRQVSSRPGSPFRRADVA